MGPERPAKRRRPRSPAQAERERRRELERTNRSATRETARAAARAERAERRRAARAERGARRRRRAARRKARILRTLVLIETGLRRFGRLVVPAYTRRLGRGKAILVLGLNIAPFPGLGTVLYGKSERGIAQFLLTFVFLLGWLWAIADGVRIVAKAYSRPEPTPERAIRKQEAIKE